MGSSVRLFTFSAIAFGIVFCNSIAQDWDESPDLFIDITLRGDVHVWFQLPDRPSWSEDAATIVQDMLGGVALDSTKEFDSEPWQFRATAAGYAGRAGLWRQREIDAGPLFERLQEDGFEDCWIVVTYYGRAQSTEPFEFADTWDHAGTTGYDGFLDFDDSPIILIEYGFDPGRLLLILLLPHVAGVGYVAVTWFRRRRALREGRPADLRWFAYVHGQHYVLAAYLFAYAILAIPSSLDALHFLFAPLPLLAGAIATSLTVLAGVLLWQAVAGFVSTDVYQRLRSLDVSRGDVVRVHLLGLLPLTVFMACLYVPFGLDAPVTRPGLVLWGALGLGLYYYFRSLWALALGFTPDALSTGELRERINELAQKAGVRIGNVYTMMDGPLQMVNAFATPGQTVTFTRKLLANLSRREVDAIAAHELAHLRLKHPLYLAALWGALFFGVTLITLNVSMADAGIRPLIVFGFTCYAVIMLAGNRFHRLFERHADRKALEILGDPEALISAYARLATLNMLPMAWSRAAEAGLSHPSMQRRIEAIAEAGSVSPERVQTLIHHGLDDSGRYPLPDDEASRKKVFSTAAKQRIHFRMIVVSFALMGVLPALYYRMLSSLADDAAVGGAVVWGSAPILAALLVFVIGNYVLVQGQRTAANQLAARLQPPDGAVFVELAPHAAPRIYEGFTSWDFGFARFDGDSFVYHGEETAFALRREQIARVRVQTQHIAWLRPVGFVIEWQADERSGHFTLAAASGRSVLDSKRKTRQLVERFRAWLNESQGSSDGARDDGLAPPALPDVSSQAIHEAYGVKAVAITVGFACVVSVVACAAFGLIGGDTPNTYARAAIVTTFAAQAVTLLPIFLGRDRLDERTIFQRDE